MTLEQKYTNLQQIIKEMGSVLVAFSGGIDSTLMLKVTHDLLGNRAAGATAVSPAYAASELEGAVSLAKTIGARHLLIQTDQLNDEAFARNDRSRCYFCKHELYEKLIGLAKQEGFSTIANGTNLDDLGDYRPGLQAAKELGIRSPLLEAHLNKEEIRSLSQCLSLPNWDKPADACLSSRIPYGVSVTRDRLTQIEQAEAFLRTEGFQQFRVRYHNELIRIEVSQDEMARWSDSALRLRLSQALKALGFTYITLDLEGYRRGSMNEGK